jgi:hypothetical protein
MKVSARISYLSKTKYYPLVRHLVSNDLQPVSNPRFGNEVTWS